MLQPLLKHYLAPIGAFLFVNEGSCDCVHLKQSVIHQPWATIRHLHLKNGEVIARDTARDTKKRKYLAPWKVTNE